MSSFSVPALSIRHIVARDLHARDPMAASLAMHRAGQLELRVAPLKPDARQETSRDILWTRMTALRQKATIVTPYIQSPRRG
jgi:hypothetical protein